MLGAYPLATVSLGDLLKRLIGIRRKKEYTAYLQKRNFVVCQEQRGFEIINNKTKFILIQEI
jgi:hypothetical protein